MSFSTSISAFAHRSARPAARLQMLGWSAALAAGLVVLSAWLCARADGPPGGLCYYECPTLPPLGWSVLGLADLFALFVLGAGLLVLAPAVVAATVAAERRAGTLDQLRTTPLSPLALCGGLILGAPSRIYLVLVGPLLLHVACAVLGAVPWSAALGALVLLFCGGLASVVFGLAVALAPQRDTGGGGFVALGVAGVLGLGGFLAACCAQSPDLAGWSFLHPIGALDAAMLQHDGLWRRIAISPWRFEHLEEAQPALALAPILSSLCSLALAALLGAACCRRLANPQRPLLGKAQAIALFAGVAAGAILPAWSLSLSERHLDNGVRAFLLLLGPVAALLALCASPSPEAWAMALRRSPHRRWFSDEAPPHATIWVMGLLVLVALSAIGWPPLLHDLHDEDSRAATLWALATFASLPLLVHFLATRFTSPGERWGFGVAALAHLWVQAIGVILCGEGKIDRPFTEVAALAGLVVPSLIAWRQLALRRRTLAASAPIPRPGEA